MKLIGDWPLIIGSCTLLDRLREFFAHLRSCLNEKNERNDSFDPLAAGIRHPLMDVLGRKGPSLIIIILLSTGILRR